MLLTSLSNRPQNRGGQRYGDRHIKQAQALSWFVNDCFNRGLAVNIADYEADPNICMENAVLAADHSKDTATVADKPKKFSYKEWISWEESFEAYLESCTGVNGALLSYIIRKDLPVGTQWNSLEKFITALQKHFKMLERYGVPMYENEKVELLFDKCQNKNPEFKMDVGICRAQCSTFINAITYLKTSVSRIFPQNVGGNRRDDRRGH